MNPPCEENEKDRLIIKPTDSKEGDRDERVRVDNRQSLIKRTES